jgi:histidinol-phosphatase (PHP family)
VNPIYLIDYHIHPDYSIDAQPYSISEYCQRAIELGLKEIAFTPHYEFDITRKEIDWYVRVKGEVRCLSSDWLESYFIDIDLAKQEFSSHGLVIRAGIEAGYDLGFEEFINKIIKQYPFDYVLGSVHCLDHIAISSKEESSSYFQGKSPKEVLKQYYSTLEEGVKTGLFDMIGHLDIYRRFGYQYFGQSLIDKHLDYAYPIFQEMAKRGIGLEINTSSIKQGFKQFYPGHDLLEAAALARVKNITLGSDAHCINELGRGVKDAWKLLKSNFDLASFQLVGFQDRLPYNLP